MNNKNYIFLKICNMDFWKSNLKIILIIFVFGGTMAYSQNYISVKGGSLKMSGNATIKADHVILKEAGVMQMTSDNNHLTLSGDFVNNSGRILQLNQGTVAFVGTPAQNINGSNDFVFQNIEVNANKLVLGQDIQVNGTLTLIKGNVDLRNNSLDLSNTGEIVNELNNHRIIATDGFSEGKGIGKIYATRFIDFGQNYNIAGLGIDINSTSYVGIKTIVRSHLTSNIGETVSIARSFTLPEFGNFSENNNVTIHYFQNELNGLNENNLAIYSFKNSKLSESFPTSIDNTSKKAFPQLTSLSISNNNSSDGYSNFTLAYKTKLNDDNNNTNEVDGENFKVFYAPSSKTVNIQYVAKESKNFTVSIYNALSAKVTSMNFVVQEGENSLRIDVSNLRKSMYFVSMSNKKQIFSSKFIIE